MPALHGGQRRPVTALFADIVGSTSIAERLDAEEWSDIVGEAVRRMAEAVARYDGHVDQLLGDGVVAFFGLRVAHEDDPQRAVRAGLEIVNAMRRYSDEAEREHGLRLPVRVGINTGPVVVRELGDTAGRTDVTALGDVVNGAARMQAEARPDTVLVTAATHGFVVASTASRHVGMITLKGKAEAVDAYEIERWTGPMARPRGIPGLTSPMVGRDPQLAALAELMPAVRAGRGRAAIVIGEPGIGKSRLIAELHRIAGAEPSPGAWHEARCLSYGRSVPFHLVSGIVRSVLGLPAPELGIDTPGDVEDPGGADRPSAGWQQVDDPYLAHLLALPVPPDASQEIARLDPTVLQGRYVEAMRGVIAEAAGARPVVVVCEDVHWADPASVDLIGRLLPHLQDLPVLVLMAARPDRDAPGWALVTAARDRYGDVLVDLRLTALSVADSRALVAGLLEIESLASTTRDYILERADGNPFFIEEVIRILVDRGAIERRDGRWVATRTVESGEIPETLHGLLLARIDRLDPEAREVLRVASVIGRRFPVSVLARAMARR
ncbi:hypothetical protein BH20CHL7_BH20CHL7_05910 [soil metagenome]